MILIVEGNDTQNVLPCLLSAIELAISTTTALLAVLSIPYQESLMNLRTPRKEQAIPKQRNGSYFE